MATISKVGITNGGTLEASHITNIIDALDGTSATATVIATGSFKGTLDGTATTASYVANAVAATTAVTATTSSTAAITNTTSGGGPFYVTFVDGTTGNRATRVDSGALTFNANTNTLTTTAFAGTASFATTASLALTASYAENAGGGGEYMTIRLYTQRTDTATVTYYTGVGADATSVNRTGIMLPFNCDIVSASVYTNAIGGAKSGTTSILTPTLYYNVTTTPAVAVAFGTLNLQAFNDGESEVVAKSAAAGTWLSLRVDEGNDSTCEYTIACDVLIKKI
jgi:hypothetical protein